MLRFSPPGAIVRTAKKQTPMKSIRSTRICGVGALVLSGAWFLQAEPITYTFATTGTGTFAGTSFTDAAITVTSNADTSTVVSYLSGTEIFDNFPTSTTLNIAGFAPATFTDPTFWEDPNDSGDIIFGIVDTSTGFAFCDNCHALLGITALFSGLESYNLESSLGPVFSPFDFETGAFNTFQNISTSEGTLSLVATNDTFTAVTASPEPASLWLAGLGLAGLLVIHKLPGKEHLIRLGRSTRL
jgi:hypothetical protein